MNIIIIYNVNKKKTKTVKYVDKKKHIPEFWYLSNKKKPNEKKY